MIATRFDSPVGTADERASGEIPPGPWLCTNPYLNYYELSKAADGTPIMAYHTGSDLLIEPYGGMGQPIYACADGVITFAARIPNSSWGNLIIQRCALPDGQTLYIRYAHENPMLVKAGDSVTRGQQIALESDAFGRFKPHLHLDFSLTAVLRDHPADWPGLDYGRVQQDYVDPLVFIKEHHVMSTLDILNGMKAELGKLNTLVDQALAAAQPAEPPPAPPPDPVPTPKQATVTAQPFLHVRVAPSTTAARIGDLLTGATIMVVDSGTADGLAWCKITEGDYRDRFVAKNYLSFQ